MSTPPIHTFEDLLTVAARCREKRVSVVAPANQETFEAVIEARNNLPVKCILVGDREVIEHGLRAGTDHTANIEIVHQPVVLDALRTAIDMVHDGNCDILMKGSVDTGAMMRAVLDEHSGLRTGRLLSDIFVLEYPQRELNKFIMITDGGMTLAPDLKNKVELIRNAVEVAHALGNASPKVAVLSATEFVVPNLPSTLDAAALSKMNERGQISGCVVDGPFALDNAISPEAAAEKGLSSPVAGRAEILVAANIESANSLAKSTTYFAGLRLAHVIVGGKVPVLIPSRADKRDAKLLSIALGMLMSESGSV
ncbi:MAG: bifunctional enoyl-CoA hydratase/phosphate acetyltransferase [Ignavibacteria bacterium]|nr:bifunctional enoyl-CoA hydratase/phosphate acetyltransferase [Ignavibacteria bacterium]